MIGKTLIAGLINIMLVAAGPGPIEKPPVLRGAKETFAVSPSHWEDRLLLYSLKQEVEGETASYVPGPLVSLSKIGQAWRVREIKPVAADIDSGSIVWAKGNAYVTSSRGIYRLRPNGVAEKIYSGQPRGLAVSRDGTTLAFWLSPQKLDVLTVLRISDRRVLKRWPLPFKVQTESSGWQLAFAPDGGSILARTYDEETGPDLKVFDLRTGSMTTLLRDCVSIVQSGDGIFVLGEQDETRDLYRFSGGKLELLTHINNRVDSLTPTALSSVVVAGFAFKKYLWVYDAEKHSAQEVNGCTDATVLKSGQHLFFLDGKVFLDPAACPPVPPAQPEETDR